MEGPRHQLYCCGNNNNGKSRLCFGQLITRRGLCPHIIIISAIVPSTHAFFIVHQQPPSLLMPK